MASRRARASMFLEVELALTRIVAQVCAFSQKAPFERHEKAKALLGASMSRFSTCFAQQETINDSKTKICHWLVTLYPYVKNTPFLVEMCRKANDQLNRSGVKYLFDHRRCIQEDFETGWVALSSDIETAPGRLPWFVTSSGSYPCSQLNPTVRKTNENTYEFDDEEIPTKIVVSGKEFQAHQYLDRGDGTKGWFVYASSSSFPSLEGVGEDHPCRGSKEIPGHFLKRTRLWISVETPSHAILTSQKEPHPICRFMGNKIINAQEPDLELANIYESQNPLFKNFFALDDKQNILAWKTGDGRVKTFDFPTYDLRLELKEGRWCSSRHPGFYVDVQAVVMELEPHPHYLVLKNDKDDQCVIMPNREVQHAPTDFKQSHFLMNKSKASQHPLLLEFSLNKGGGLVIPEDLAKILYLIHITFRSLDYQLTRKLIQKLSLHPTQWTEKEDAIYQWMELPKTLQQQQEIKDKYTDKHPYACALRCKMRLLAIQSEAKEVDISALENDYLACLEQSNSLGSDWLTEEEEKEILQLLKGSNSLFSTREKELNALLDRNEAYFVHTQETTTKIKTSIIFPSLLSDIALQQRMAETSTPAPIALQMRPGADFVFNFYSYYQIAYHKEPAKELDELRILLRLSRKAPEGSHRYLHAILTDMLSNPPKVRWPDPQKIQQFLREGKLEDCVHSLVRRSWALSQEQSLPLLSSLQDKLVESRDFDKNVVPGKGVRLKRALATMEPLIPFTTAIGENPEINRFKQFLSRQNPREKIERLSAEIAQLEELLTTVYQLPPDWEDPCVINSFVRTRRGIEEKIAEQKDNIVMLRAPNVELYCLPTLTSQRNEAQNKKVEDLAQEMARVIDRSEAKLKEKEAVILKKLHSYPEELRIQVDGGLIKPLELQELLVWFGSQNDEKILHGNPSLKGKLGELKTKVAEYLIDLTEHHQLIRAEKELKETRHLAASQGWNFPSTRHIAENFVSTLMAKRAYDAQHPKLAALLVFEAFSGLRLRGDQIRALEQLGAGTQLLDVEMEARTGAGKSQIIIPLWLFLTSRVDRLTMMTVPTALLPDQLLHLRKMLGNAFSVGIQQIKFERERSCDLAYLKKINCQLHEAQRKKWVLLIDIKSLHGLSHLALKQALVEKGDPALTHELLKLRKTLQTKLSNFIDESRECLDVRQRYDYSIGQPVAVTTEQCEQVGRLFETTILSGAILEKWNFEFLPQFHAPAKLTLTAENVHLLLEDLANQMVDHLTLDADHSELREHLKAHLLGGHPVPQVRTFLERLPIGRRRDYAWNRRQLTSTLRRTLLRSCGERYNLYREGRIAIPCLRGVPKPTSEFATLDDHMIFTAQANIKRAFHHHDVEGLIHSLQQLVIVKAEKIVEHPVYQLFITVQTRMGSDKSVTEMTGDDIQKMTQFLNSKEAFHFRLEFIKKAVLPTITFFKKKISGTSFNVVRSQRHVQGASGTVDPDTLPPRMKPMEKASAPIGNLLAMYQHSRFKVMESCGPEECLSELLAADQGHRVIVDAAGYFRDLSQEKIVNILSAKTEDWDSSINGVTYYDDEGRCMILERGAAKSIPREHSRLSAEEVMIFIRQSKSVGSDVPMTPMAKAFVTVGKDTMESFFWQAAGRMRGLGGGQSLDIVSTREDAQVFATAFQVEVKDLRIPHLFQYVKKIESQQKGIDYFLSLRLYLEDLVENLLWQHLDHPDRFADVLFKIRPLLIDETENDPLDSLFLSQEPIPAIEAVKSLKESVVARLKDLAEADQSLEEGIREIETAFDQHVDFKKLPNQIVMSASIGQEAEIEVEEEAIEDAEQTQEQEQEQEQIGEKRHLHFTPIEPKAWDGDYTSVFKEPTRTICGRNFSSFFTQFLPFR